jgi:hypothetical protein
MQIPNHFSSRIVRDLAWVIASPPLISGNIQDTHWWSHADCVKEFYDCYPFLKALDDDPQALIDHLNNLKSTRLGSVFEGLVAYWLMISPNYQLLSQNIQIIEDGVTFGEIDFIIRDLNTHKNIHLEVAVKFYLGSPPYEDPYRWFGTNTKDQLGKKTQHLISHQTQLSNKYPSHFDCEIDQRQCFIKGRLFYPAGVTSSPKGMNISNNHLRGSWCFENDYKRKTNIISIEKNHWLAEYNHQDITEYRNVNSGFSKMSKLDRAQCFVLVEGKNKTYYEAQRVFYLPEKFSFPTVNQK